MYKQPKQVVIVERAIDSDNIDPVTDVNHIVPDSIGADPGEKASEQRRREYYIRQ